MADNGITLKLEGIKGEAGTESDSLNVMSWNCGYPALYSHSPKRCAYQM